MIPTRSASAYAAMAREANRDLIYWLRRNATTLAARCAVQAARRRARYMALARCAGAA